MPGTSAPFGGGYVYVANGANVPGFARDQSTGALTQLAGSPFAGGPGATSVAVDTSGNYLYVLGNTSQEVSGFLIDKSTGALSAVAGSPFALDLGATVGAAVIVTSQ
jgi:6-phosphogluconolactonase